MSDLPARREQVSFPNPGVSKAQWYLDMRTSPLTRNLGLLPLAGTVLGGAAMVVDLAFHHQHMSAEESGILLGFAMWPGLLIGLGVYKLVSDRIARKQLKYRREHARLLIDVMAEQGWVAYGDDPVQHLIEDDYPYFYNNQFRYKTYNKVITDKSVEWNFVLDDDKAEALYRDDEMARRIEHLTAEYEKANGPLSPENKAIFQSALKMDTGK